MNISRIATLILTLFVAFTTHNLAAKAAEQTQALRVITFEGGWNLPIWAA